MSPEAGPGIAGLVVTTMKLGWRCRLLSLVAVGAMLACAVGAALGDVAPRSRVRDIRIPRRQLLVVRPAAPELVAHLPLRGNANDASGGGNHGTVNGPTLTADRFGNANCAYSFDGVDDYIVLANEAHFDLSNYTIAMHVKLTDLPTPPSPSMAGQYTLISKGANCGNFMLSLMKSGGAGYCRLSYGQQTTGGTWGSGTGGMVTVGEFHHVAATVEGSTIKLYVDGELVLTRADVPPRMLSNGPVFIGRGESEAHPHYLKGVVDDVRVYSRALSAAEIAEVREVAEGPPELVLHLPFSGDAQDASGSGNHATVNGATLTADRLGSASCAYSLDGTDDYLEVSNEESFDVPDFTVAMWVELGGLPTPPGPATAAGYTLISKGSNCGNFTVRLMKYGGAGYCRVSYAQRVAGGTWSSGSAGRVNLGEFQHVAVTVEGTTLKVYVDGELELTRTDLGARTLNNEPVLIGRSPGSVHPDFFRGVVDEVRIYNRALSAGEVAGLCGGS